MKDSIKRFHSMEKEISKNYVNTDHLFPLNCGDILKVCMFWGEKGPLNKL